MLCSIEMIKVVVHKSSNQSKKIVENLQKRNVMVTYVTFFPLDFNTLEHFMWAEVN